MEVCFSDAILAPDGSQQLYVMCRQLRKYSKCTFLLVIVPLYVLHVHFSLVTATLVLQAVCILNEIMEPVNLKLISIQ